MKVLVLGSGVIGVCSAWYLQKAGHEVTVVDRQPGPAQETSFANAGQVSFGYTTPWAAPGLMIKALKWMLHGNSPLIIHPKPSWTMIRWLLSVLANCDSHRYKSNKALMVRVSHYSEHCLAKLREETGIHYDERMRGTIQLFRSPKQLAAAQKDIEVLKSDGIAFNLLNPDQCVEAEPGLAPLRTQIVAGLQTPDDETGDCQAFTEKLSKLAQAAGVKFLFDTTINRLRVEGDKIIAVETSNGLIQADSYVVALASFTPFLLKPLGLRAPIYPVKGYSITLPIIDETKAPLSTVIDDSYKVAVTRLGDRIRVGGMAEVSGYKISLPERRLRTLREALHLMFQGAADEKYQPQLWSGLRPVTPDSVPIIGKTKISNLFTNAGHGTLGWTMATGSGKLLADIVSGQETEIDHDGLSIERYRH